MIGFAFLPYEDEVLYGWVVRYHKYSINRVRSQSLIDLFNDGYLNLKIQYPNNISTLSKNMDGTDEFEIEEILNKLTYINMMKPFYDEERYLKVKNAIINHDSGTYRNHGFHVNDLFKSDKDTIKVCPLCYQEDFETLGESYIHRHHNVIGVRTCIKHGCYLDVVVHTFHSTQGFYDIERDYTPQEIKYPSEATKPFHDELNKNIEYVLNGNLNSLTQDMIKAKVQMKLRLLGVFTVYNTERHPILIGFLEKYGEDFLKEYESTFTLQEKKIWVRSYLHQQSGITNPIRQIIILSYLFGSMEQLISFTDEFKPFGDTPYPCLNHICDHYHKDVIKDYTETLDDFKMAVIGTFKCDVCGYTYTKRSNADNVEDRYSSTLIKTRGDLWREQLRLLILEGKYSSNILGEMMKADKRDILKHAGDMGLAHYFNTKRDKGHKGKEIVYTIDIEDYRQQLLKFMKLNPEFSRKDIKQEMNKVFGTLFKRDREWLDENLPPAFDRTKMKHQEFDEAYWLEKESELITKYQNVVEKMKQDEVQVRITKNVLMIKSNTGGALVKKFLDKMPGLQRYLDEVTEELGAYKVRTKKKR